MSTLRKNSVKAQFEHLSCWMAVTGYILPRTEGEMKRFDKLYKDYKTVNSIEQLDFNKIWDDEDQFDINVKSKVVNLNPSSFRMAARGLNELPKDVIDAINKNQKSALDELDGK